MGHFAAGIFLEQGTEAIQELRRRYDPTAELIDPHVTLLFPVPESVGKEHLLEHLEEAAASRPPFEIRLGGFYRTDDHWLCLTLAQGAQEMQALYERVYSGILEDFRNPEVEFVPHLGLGLFLREGFPYEMEDPDPASFDEKSYDQALAEAERISFDRSETAREIRVVTIPDSVIDWATGELSGLPGDAQAMEVARVRLGTEFT